MTPRRPPVMSSAFFWLFCLGWFLVGGLLLVVNVFAFNDMPGNKDVLTFTFLASLAAWLLLPLSVRLDFRAGRKGLLSLFVMLSWCFSTGLMFLVLSSK